MSKKRYRKWLLGPISILGTLGLVAGCGSPADKTNQTTSSNQPASAAKSKTTAFPLTLTDQAGNKVKIPKKPVRIASTTEGTDEILAALVPKKDVCMVTTYATQKDFSNVIGWAKGIPAIQDTNAEQIIAVHPDLVLAASYTKPGVVKEIEQSGIPVFEFTDFNSIPGIEQNIELVGKLVGEQAKADKVVANMKQQIQAVQQAVKGQPKVSVLDYSSYGFVAGGGTTVNDVIADAGGINVASKLQGWQKVTDEEIVKMNPQVIIDADSDQAFVKKIMSDPELQTVSAVKHHRVYTVNGADLSSVSQYIARGVKDVAHVLYPSVKLPQ